MLHSLHWLSGRVAVIVPLKAISGPCDWSSGLCLATALPLPARWLGGLRRSAWCVTRQLQERRNLGPALIHGVYEAPHEHGAAVGVVVWSGVGMKVTTFPLSAPCGVPPTAQPQQPLLLSRLRPVRVTGGPFLHLRPFFFILLSRPPAINFPSHTTPTPTNANSFPTFLCLHFLFFSSLHLLNIICFVFRSPLSSIPDIPIPPGPLSLTYPRFPPISRLVPGFQRAGPCLSRLLPGPSLDTYKTLLVECL